MNISSKKESDPWSREQSHKTRCFLRKYDTVKNKLAKIKTQIPPLFGGLISFLETRVGVKSGQVTFRHVMCSSELFVFCDIGASRRVTVVTGSRDNTSWLRLS